MCTAEEKVGAGGEVGVGEAGSGLEEGRGVRGQRIFTSTVHVYDTDLEEWVDHRGRDQGAGGWIFISAYMCITTIFCTADGVGEGVARKGEREGERKREGRSG